MTQTAEPKPVYTIELARDEIEAVVTLDELAAIQANDMATIKRVFGQFVHSDGTKLPPDEGRKVIGKMTLANLRAAVGQFQAAVERIEVHPLNE